MPLPLPPPPRSFVDRVTTSLPDLQRPRTAPSKIVNIPERAKSFAELSATFAVSPRTYLEDNEESFPPPPLPLVLQQRRPPLRKKKSFTRVSNWLKGGDANDNAPSHFVSTTVTNAPKNITAREGFYQCVGLANYTSNANSHSRTHTASISTVSTFAESELDEPTLPTSWTPRSSPSRHSTRKFQSRSEENGVRIRGSDYGEQSSMELSRIRTFGEKEAETILEGWKAGEVPVFVPQRGSVGVAF